MESLRTGGNMLVPVSCGQGSQAPHLPHLLATNASSCRYQRAHHSLAKRGYESDEHCASDSEEDDNHTCGESEPAGKGIKRRCSSSGASQDSSGTQEEELASHHQDTGAFEGGCSPERACAEVLQLLRAGSWDEADKPPVVHQLNSLSTGDDAATDARALAPCGKGSPSKRRRTAQRGERAGCGGPRRKYTWRSFHHRGKVVEEQQSEEESDKASECPEAVHPVSTDEDSPSGSSHKERDKEWAALTTWLRMNLHQPRTNKRVVLFTADHPAPGQPWVFHLNSQLSWDDVSEETKLRLKTLPEETEAAFAHKYPSRPSHEWQAKTQKYRPVGESATIQVPLGEMVYSLRDMYALFESDQHSC
uniref:Uncharacterized protein n=1 Tax=Tetraselmis chuii TaxID=63592 RepID=A0A7S1SU11_9CHLO